MEIKRVPVVTTEWLAELMGVSDDFICDRIFHYDYHNETCQRLYFAGWDEGEYNEEPFEKELYEKLQALLPNDNYLLVEFYW